MKFSRIIIAAALLSLPVMASAASCDASDIHCVSFLGLQGKYVKVSATIGSETDSFSTCFDNNSTIAISPSAIESGFLHVGDVVNAEFMQCSDQTCRESIPVGNESFSIDKKAQGGYTTTPASYVVQLDDTYGEACTPDFRKSAMLHSHYVATHH